MKTNIQSKEARRLGVRGGLNKKTTGNAVVGAVHETRLNVQRVEARGGSLAGSGVVTATRHRSGATQSPGFRSKNMNQDKITCWGVREKPKRWWKGRNYKSTDELPVNSGDLETIALGRNRAMHSKNGNVKLRTRESTRKAAISKSVSDSVTQLRGYKDALMEKKQELMELKRDEGTVTTGKATGSETPPDNKDDKKPPPLLNDPDMAHDNVRKFLYIRRYRSLGLLLAAAIFTYYVQFVPVQFKSGMCHHMIDRSMEPPFMGVVDAVVLPWSSWVLNLTHDEMLVFRKDWQLDLNLVHNLMHVNYWLGFDNNYEPKLDKLVDWLYVGNWFAKVPKVVFTEYCARQPLVFGELIADLAYEKAFGKASTLYNQSGAGGERHYRYGPLILCCSIMLAVSFVSLSQRAYAVGLLENDDSVDGRTDAHRMMAIAHSDPAESEAIYEWYIEWFPFFSKGDFPLPEMQYCFRRIVNIIALEKLAQVLGAHTNLPGSDEKTFRNRITTYLSKDHKTNVNRYNELAGDDVVNNTVEFAVLYHMERQRRAKKLQGYWGFFGE